MVKVIPLPQGEEKYPGARIRVNGALVEAYRCRVSAMPFNRSWPGHQRSLDQTELAAFVMLEMDEMGQPAEISVQVDGEVEAVHLRPLSKNVPVLRGLGIGQGDLCNEFNFTLTRCGQYVLEINDHHCPIMFFVNPVRTSRPDPQDERVRYFGPGVHRPGKIRLESGQTLYIAPGAVVHTSVFAENARNIRIMGGGILDNSSFERTSGGISCDSPLTLYNCENVEISDVVFRDSACFTIRGMNLTNVCMDNIKIVGNWRYNSDGIDLYNSRNVSIQNCFVRTFDDSIVIKAQKPYDFMNCENWVVSGCVVWCDWGRALEIGAETRADEYRNILFTDCDIIHCNGVAMDVQNNGDSNCHDIVFDNIRVEYKKSLTPGQMQASDDSVYEFGQVIDVPPVMSATIPQGYCHPWLCGEDGPYGRNRRITFRNVWVTMPEDMPVKVPPSVFQGHSETEDTRDVRIEGLYVNGRRITDREEANLQIGPFASDIHFE